MITAQMVLAQALLHRSLRDNGDRAHDAVYAAPDNAALAFFDPVVESVPIHRLVRFLYGPVQPHRPYLVATSPIDVFASMLSKIAAENIYQVHGLQTYRQATDIRPSQSRGCTVSQCTSMLYSWHRGNQSRTMCCERRHSLLLPLAVDVDMSPLLRRIVHRCHALTTVEVALYDFPVVSSPKKPRQLTRHVRPAYLMTMG